MIISGNEDELFEVTDHHSTGYEAGRVILHHHKSFLRDDLKGSHL